MKLFFLLLQRDEMEESWKKKSSLFHFHLHTWVPLYTKDSIPQERERRLAARRGAERRRGLAGWGAAAGAPSVVGARLPGHRPPGRGGRGCRGMAGSPGRGARGGGRCRLGHRGMVGCSQGATRCGLGRERGTRGGSWKGTRAASTGSAGRAARCVDLMERCGEEPRG